MPKEDGWINTDLYWGEGVDEVFDANGHWPFPDEMFYEVRSNHVLEHISNYMNYFRETWRVLKPNGSMWLQLPYGWSSACWWDLTHLRPWLQESFAGLQPGYIKYTRNLQHEDIGCAFWVHQVVLMLQKNWARMWRFRPLRPFVKWAMKHLLNIVQDIIVEAVKTTKDDPRSTAYGGVYHPASVPCNIGMLESHFYGRNSDESDRIIIFGSSEKSTAEDG